MRTSNRWEMLEVRHLRAFVAVAELGSVAGAARSLGYTQSGVSQQLQALESIVGETVLRRYPGGRQPAELTQAGELLLGHARHLLARVQATAADLATVSGGRQRTVAVATNQSLGARVLPAVLSRFRAENPSVQVTIQEMRDPDAILGAIETGAVDLGLVALPVDESLFAIHHLVADPYVLVLPPSDLTANADPVQTPSIELLKRVRGRRVLGIKACTHDQLVSVLLRQMDIQPAAERFDDNELIQQLVAAGEGVAIVPGLTIRTDDPRIVLVPLPDLPPRQLAAVTHADRALSPTVGEFITITQEVSRAVCPA